MSHSMWSLIATLIGGLISGLAGYNVARSNREAVQETNETNLTAVRETNELNKQLAGEANEWQAQQWQHQFDVTAAFNSPSAQIERYKSAGLNPALAMGGSPLDATVTAPSTPSAHPAAASPFQAIAPTLNGFDTSVFADTASKMAQARLLNSQARELDARSGLSAVESELKSLQVNAENLIQHNPVYEYVSAVMPDGTSSSELVRVGEVNLRVESAKIENSLKQSDLKIKSIDINNLWLNWFLMSGVFFGDDGILNNPEDAAVFKDWDSIVNSPTFNAARKMLVGAAELQDYSLRLAELTYELKKSESAGAKAFNAFLEKHKDSPFLQLLLVFRGYLQNASSLPSLGLPPVNFSFGRKSN